jgi:hypothetical protein
VAIWQKIAHNCLQQNKEACNMTHYNSCGPLKWFMTGNISMEGTSSQYACATSLGFSGNKVAIWQKIAHNCLQQNKEACNMTHYNSCGPLKWSVARNISTEGTSSQYACATSLGFSGKVAIWQKIAHNCLQQNKEAFNMTHYTSCGPLKWSVAGNISF